MRVPFAFACVVLVCALGAADCGEPVEVPTLEALRTELFVPRCGNAGCHGGANPAAGLDLVTDPHAGLVGVDALAIDGKRVVAGDADASVLFQILNGPVGPTEQMPVGFQLPAEDIAAVEAWINAGANDD